MASGGVEWGFASLGLACLAGTVIGGLVIREGPHAEAPSPSARTGRALRDRAIWRLSIGSALLIAPQLCIGGFAVLFLHERRGLSASSAAAVLAATQVLAIGGRIAAGRWSDVRGSRVEPLRAFALAAAAFVALAAAVRDGADRSARARPDRRDRRLDELEPALVRRRRRDGRAGAQRVGDRAAADRPERAGRGLPGPVRRTRRRELVVGRLRRDRAVPARGLARAASIAEMTRDARPRPARRDLRDRRSTARATRPRRMPRTRSRRGGCARPGSRCRSTTRATCTAGAGRPACGAARISTAFPRRAASTERSASSPRSRRPSGCPSAELGVVVFRAEETGPIGQPPPGRVSGRVRRAAHRAGARARAARRAARDRHGDRRAGARGRRLRGTGRPRGHDADGGARRRAAQGGRVHPARRRVAARRRRRHRRLRRGRAERGQRRAGAGDRQRRCARAAARAARRAGARDRLRRRGTASTRSR